MNNNVQPFYLNNTKNTIIRELFGLNIKVEMGQRETKMRL